MPSVGKGTFVWPPSPYKAGSSSGGDTLCVCECECECVSVCECECECE